MAGTLTSIWGPSFRQAEQPETPAAVEVVHPVSRLRRGLLRTITQPQGLYEAILETFGPTTIPDSPEFEDLQVEEAFQNLHVSDISDTATCSSREDDRAENHSINTVDDHSEIVAWDRHDHLKTKARKLSDEEWAKSILGRKTGYGSIQRHRVVKYRTYLETRLTELQTEVLALHSQVGIFDQHRRYLQVANDALHHKIAKLSRYQLLNEDQHVFLQQELQLLRILQAEQQLLPQVDSGGSGTSEGEPSTGHGIDTSIELRHRDSALSDAHVTGKEPEFGETPHENETSRDLSMADSWSRVSSGFRQQDDVEAPKRSLVKWPSTLYRSVSAIRKDARMLQPEQLLLRQLDSGPGTSEGGPNTGHGIDTSDIQLRDHDSAQSDVQATGTGPEFEESPQENEPSRIKSMADSWNTTRSGFWQDDDDAMKRRLVKWPSTLYRSVSAIRKDVLGELAVLDSNND